MNSNKEFDKILVDKFNNFSPQRKAEAWTDFEKSMNAELDFDNLSQDMAFDDKIRQEVSKIGRGTPSKHWVKLKNTLQLIDDRKKEIWIGALAQMAIVFLFVSFGYDNLKFYRIKVQDLQYATLDQSATKAYADNPALTELQEIRKDIQWGKSDFLSNTSNDIVNLLDADIDFELDLQTGLSISDNFLTDFHQKESGIALETQPTFAASLQDYSESYNDLSDNKLIQEKSDINLSYKSENIDPFILKTESGEIFTNGLVAFIPVKRKNAGTIKAVSAFYSADVNLINTPFDKVYSVASYTKEAFNQSAGLLLSLRKGNLSLESGLRYTDLSYVPQIIKEEHNQVADLYFETSLDKISFRIIHVPMHLKFHFVSKPQWNAYLVCGAGFNMIAESDFEISTNIRQGRNGLRSGDQDLRLIDEKRFNLGVFEGGSLKENYFITAAMGFGIEKKLAGHFNLFTQAVYNRHLISDDIGVGPNKDNIHTMSFQGGVKVLLN